MPSTVYGVRESLAELRRVDPELRRALQRDLRGAAQPMRAAIVAGIPAAPPLSGLARWWIRPRRVSTRTGGRPMRGRDLIPLLRVSARAGAVRMTDMARRPHSKQGAAMIRGLGRSASRYVYPAAESAMPQVSRAVADVCARIVQQTDRRLLQIGTK